MSVSDALAVTALIISLGRAPLEDWVKERRGSWLTAWDAVYSAEGATPPVALEPPPNWWSRRWSPVRRRHWFFLAGL